MNRISRAVLAVMCFAISAHTMASDNGPKITRQQYIEQWKDVAIEQMQIHGIPASIKLAQGILESADGNSMLARKANNHFGIKCHGWSGPGVYKDDDKKNECFRKYRNAQESFDDHSEFLKKTRYAFLFDYKTTDYKAWAHGLKKAGYATNPKYPQLLIRIIEENELYRYDSVQKNKRREVVAEKPKKESGGAVIDYTIGYREMITDNNVKFVFAKGGDSYDQIARNLGLRTWQLVKYNDAEKTYQLQEGERVYVKPKRNKATAKMHVVQEGQTLRQISQLHAIKMKRLMKYNAINENTPLQSGQKIKLRR